MERSRRRGNMGRGRGKKPIASENQVGAFLGASERNNVGMQSGNKVKQSESPSMTASRRDDMSSGDCNREKPTEVTNEVPRKFELACAKIQSLSQKFVKDFNDGESSEEEEQLDSSNIMSKVMNGYIEEVPENPKELQRTRQYLTDSLVSGAVVCLVCIESIKRQEAVWSCHQCCCMFHLSCIQKWAKDSMFHLQQENESADLKWFCPKCREEYRAQDKPTEYRCFCGKVKDPTHESWQVPHSCGEICSKNLKPQCGHRCVLLCHPGPCPPCPKMVKSTCYCEKETPHPRRCGNRFWSCSKPCGKLLSCKQHNCEIFCHPGDCKPCPKKSIQKCVCGNESRMQMCASSVWQCVKKCSKTLPCGFHKCEQVCHTGDCGECPRAASRTCPCGKSTSQLPCTEDIHPCGDTCDKLLECGFHWCSHRCHYGKCGECLQMRIKRCQCGSREKSFLCSKDFFCEVKCKRMRDCRRHQCNKKCCDGNCPPCKEPCGKTLTCRNHKCESRCHQGPCYPCTQKVDLSCRCQETKVTVPCGREKVAKIPQCTKPCKIPPDCDHEKRNAHPCHQGHCSPCTQKCSKIMNCGHVCPAKCHIAVRTKIVPNESKRAGPWEPVPAPREELVTKPCPPCQFPIPVQCQGEHGIQDFPCSEVRVYSCGRLCGRQLPCANHTCTLECHQVTGAIEKAKAGTNCIPCAEPCRKPRPEGCTHFCPKQCHPEDCAPCNQFFRMKCHCGLNQLFISCHQWAFGNKEQKIELQCCKNRCCKELECGHRCPLICHLGPCAPKSHCKKKVTLRCPCKRLKMEYQCNKAVPVNCDQACEEAKELEQQKQLELEKSKEAAANHESEVIQEFRPRRKRRDRRRNDVVEEKSRWGFMCYVGTGFGIIILSVIVYWMLKM